MGKIIEARNIRKIFSLGGIIRRKYITAVEDFNLSVEEETPKNVTLAGESGSGKTTIANLLLGFIKPTYGEVLYNGKNIWKMNRLEWRTYRREVQAVFQDPFESLNPFYKIDDVLLETIEKFKLANSKSESIELAKKALNDVGLEANEVLGKYPHQLSGGQRQRVMLARVFIIRPKVLIADEPVSMIDVSLRADILKIIQRLRNEFGMSCIYITHDLSTAYCISDEIIVLYLGNVMEQGNFEKIVKNPKHPYVKMLISSIPQPDPRNRWKGRINLQNIEATQLEATAGCKFYNRCPEAIPICSQKKPPLIEVEKDRKIACHLFV
jgi:peptide/nickel transport system ATP-binding protein